MLWAVEHIPRFVSGISAFQSLAENAKAFACRHCGRVGTLIGHGYLRGYDEQSSARQLRAKRVFCSNRGHRRGCGRTDSSFLRLFVPYFTITTLTLWSLFSRVSEGLSVFDSSAGSAFPLCPRSAYRLAVRLKRARLTWRSWLATQGCTLSSTANLPLAQLHEQLQTAFGLQPFSAWQLQVQLSLL